MTKTTKPNPKVLLGLLSREMPYRSKREIADSINENPDNVQTAFRGRAGEELSKKVLRKAKRYISKQRFEQLSKEALKLSQSQIYLR